MADEVMLELAVDTTDEDLLREIEQAVLEANPQRWPETRDIGTIIALSSSSIGLVNALLALKASLARKHDKPHVTVVVRNESRDEVRLADITEQTAQALVSGSGPASTPSTGH
jgi:hypothetical protein